MILKKHLLFLHLLFLSLFVNAQTEWTLKDCIDYALEHNLQLRQQKLNIDYSKNTFTQSKAALLPNLNASASGNFSSGRSVDPYTYEFTENNVSSYNFSLGTSITLFNGFQKQNTIKANKYNMMASLQDYEKLKNDISLNISTAYLNILFARELLKIAKEQVHISDLQLKQTEKLVNAGSLPNGSLLEAKAQKSNDELQEVTYQNQLDMAYLALTQMPELESPDDFEIASPDLNELDESILAQSASSIFAEAVQNLPQIKSAEYKLQSSAKSLSAAKGNFYPRISANASIYSGYSNNRKRFSLVPITYPSQLIGYTNSGEEVFSLAQTGFDSQENDYPFKNQINDNAYKSVGLSLSIPIFNNMNIYYGVKNAKNNVLNYEIQMEQVKNQLYQEIQQAWADAAAALKKYHSSKESLQANEESFRYTQQKFDLGLINQVDFNLAKKQLAQVQSQLLQAKYEYLFKSSILEFYRGKTNIL